MKLWKKESNRPNALLVDIFNPQYHSTMTKLGLTNEALKISKSLFFDSHISEWQKNNANAVKQRKAGNLLFAQKKFSKAMECYNKSLCFSEIGSENISLAYANRSSCFLRMKFFDKCMIDIKLAMKAGYPKDKMEKLEKRHIDAEKAINDGLLAQKQTPTLSFPSNKEVPVLANAIRIENDRFIATKSISVGQTIYLEPFFVGEAHAGKYSNCNICLSFSECLVPCDNCTNTMFCMNDKCQKNELHKFECGIKPHSKLTHSAEVNFLMSLVRSILLAVQMFPNVDALIKFVEETMANRSKSIPDFTNPKSKYRAFLNLKCQNLSENWAVVLRLYYDIMMDTAKIANIFNTKKYQRFLMHLTVQHMSILNAGAFSKQIISTNVILTIELQMVILQASFKNSCTPNISLTFSNGAMAGIVVRPVQQDEEIMVNHFDYESRTQCNCELCESPLRVIRRNPILQRDWDFVVISSNVHRFHNQYTDLETEKLKAVCVSFLRKYGSGQWCVEIGIVIAVYRKLLSHCDVTKDFMDGLEPVV